MHSYLELLKKIKEREEWEERERSGNKLMMDFPTYFYISTLTTYSTEYMCPNRLIELDLEDIKYFKDKANRLLQAEKEEEIRKLSATYDQFL